MEKLLNKNKIIRFIIITTLIVSFLIPYSKIILDLPLYGDATIHANISKNMIENGVLNTWSSYPPLYNFFQIAFYKIFGEIGFNILVILSLVILAISIYLLIYSLTNKFYLGIISIFILLASPKIAYYTSRMYMEILLSAFLIITIYFFIKFLKNPNYINVILLALFCAITSSIKQQGLFILFPSLVIILFIKYLKIRKDDKRYFTFLISFILIFILLISPFYLILFHTSGNIIIGNEGFKIIKTINSVGQKIANYQKSPSEYLDADNKWKETIKDIRKDKFYTAYSRAEDRHIFPLDVFTSWDKFNSIHSLYFPEYKSHKAKYLGIIMQLLLILGIIIFIINIFQKNKNNTPNNKILGLFLIIFLLNNYFLFQKNTDQERYHLFISIIFIIFIILSLDKITSFFKKYINVPKNYLFLTPLIFLLSFNWIYNFTNNNIEKYYHNANLQIYSSSVGGINSIIEAGNWLSENTNSDDRIYQNCGNELKYYSSRDVTGGWEYYFLNIDKLKELLKDYKIKYLVIYQSQVVKDNNWKHICWVPETFKERVDNNFSLIYTSSVNDIFVYRIE